jgi:hypothetical protein
MTRMPNVWLMIGLLTLGSLCAPAADPPTFTAGLEGQTAGETCVNPVDSAVMRWVPAGDCTMGVAADAVAAHQEDEHPQRTLTLKGYWVYRDPVTAGQYRAFCTATGRAQPTGSAWRKLKAASAATGLTWGEAVLYALWSGVALPTEAQWEHAAGNLTAPNTEWCSDWYAPYDPAQLADPTGAATGTERVLRGGKKATATQRGHALPTNRSTTTAFRCVITAGSTQQPPDWEHLNISFTNNNMAMSFTTNSPALIYLNMEKGGIWVDSTAGVTFLDGAKPNHYSATLTKGTTDVKGTYYTPFSGRLIITATDPFTFVAQGNFKLARNSTGGFQMNSMALLPEP